MSSVRPRLGWPGLLTRVCGYSERARSPVRRWELPPPTITVILGFHDSIAVVDDTGHSRSHLRFAAGLATRSAQTQHHGVQEGLQLDLTPAGARALLGVAPAELVGRTVNLDQVSGSLTGALVDEVAELRTWEDRLITVERRLIAALPDVVEPPAQIEAAWALLRAR